jgi:uncharacterized membrane protein
MLHNIIAGAPNGEIILGWIEWAALVIEVLAVLLIVISIFYGVIRYSYNGILKREKAGRFKALKRYLGGSLSLGLEILVAADIVRTVALEATMESVLILGLLVLIRTFLSWSLVVEIEGRWPWQGTQ